MKKTISSLTNYINNFKLEEVLDIKSLNISFEGDLQDFILKNISIKDTKKGIYMLKNKKKQQEDGKEYNIIEVLENNKRIGYIDIIGLYIIFYGMNTRQAAMSKIAEDFNIITIDSKYYTQQKQIYENNIRIIQDIIDDNWNNFFLNKILKKELELYISLNEIAITSITTKDHSFNDLQVFKLSSRWFSWWLETNKPEISIKKTYASQTLNYFTLLGLIEKVKYKDIPESMIEYHKDNMPTHFIVKPLTEENLKKIEETAKVLYKKNIKKSYMSSKYIKRKLGMYYYNKVYYKTENKINAKLLNSQKNKKQEIDNIIINNFFVNDVDDSIDVELINIDMLF